MSRLSTLLLTLGVLAILGACSSSSQEAKECNPPCYSGYTCIDGRCVFGSGDEDAPTDGDHTIPLDGDQFETPDGDDDAQADVPTDTDTTPDGDDDTIPSDGDDAPDGDIVDIDRQDLDLDFPLDLTNCDFNSSLTTPMLKATPRSVDFGAVPIGQSVYQLLEVCNGGGVDLALTAIQFGAGTSTEFYKYHASLPITIPAGKSAPIHLVYLAADLEEDSGELILISNDPESSSTHIPLASSIKPTPLVQISPQIIQFAGATSGQTVTKLVEIRNVGTAATSVYNLRIENETAAYSVVQVVKSGSSQPSDPPWLLEKDEFLTATLSMTATDTQPPDDQLVVPWSTDLGTEYSYATLTAGELAICAVPVAEPDQTVQPLDTVYLDGTRSYDENGQVQAYLWEWETKPEDAYRAIIKDSNDQNIQGIWTSETKPHFYAELAGTYVIRLTVQDSEEGCTGLNYDTVTVVAVPAETIHVQLMWTSANNDHDLHLVRPDGQHSRGDASNVGDCHWTNCKTIHGTARPCPARGCPGPADAPDWAQLESRDDDPTLDIDDIDGRGPENINLSLPEEGDYLVSVENYSGGTNIGVTVRIWLFGVLNATFHYGPPYTSSGFASGKHWNVAWVRVHGPTDIEVIPINTIEDSGARLNEAKKKKPTEETEPSAVEP